MESSTAKDLENRKTEQPKQTKKRVKRLYPSQRRHSRLKIHVTRRKMRAQERQIKEEGKGNIENATQNKGDKEKEDGPKKDNLNKEKQIKDQSTKN